MGEISGCGYTESNSLWFRFTTATAGTLGFTLIPESTDIDEDYDFHLSAANVDCSNLGTAIRCSSTNPANAGLSSNHTGMRDTPDDETSEGPGPDGDSFGLNG